MAYYDSKGDCVVRYYTEKINLLLANRHVLEKVTEVSKKLVNEKDFKISTLIEESQSRKPSIDIQRQMASDVRKFEFHKKVSFIRKRNTVDCGAELSNRQTLALCSEKLNKRIEFFDKTVLTELKKDEDDLESRLRDRLSQSIASIVKNMSIMDFDDQNSVLFTSGKNSSQHNILLQSPLTKSSTKEFLIIPETM